MKELGYGEYKYAHDYNNFADQILPEALKETLFIFLGTILEKTASEIFKEQMEDKYGY
jgi:replication-associated recombination protein RarA